MDSITTILTNFPKFLHQGALVRSLQASLGQFQSVAFLRRREGGWALTILGACYVNVELFDTLAEAKDFFMQHLGEEEEAKWEADLDLRTERFYEEGTSAQQMAYQAELDAEAQALGWNPMTEGAFGGAL
jgi:hypothetical protein